MAIFRSNCKGKERKEVVAVRYMGQDFFFKMEDTTAYLHTNGNDVVAMEIWVT